MADKKQQSLKKIQAEWYKKLADEGFDDIEWNGSTSPYLRNTVIPRRDNYDATLLYYHMATAYLNNYWKLRGKERFIWKLHASGHTYEQLVTAYKAKYKTDISVYNMYYWIKELAEDCRVWYFRNYDDDDV